MIYRPFGTTGKDVSLIGVGTSRLSPEPSQFSENVDLILNAVELGINFFDTAPTYAAGVSDKILGAAFSQLRGNSFYVSTKSMLSMDADSDSVRKRVDSALKTLHIEKINFFHMWSILNIEQYRKIMAPGGPYEGVLKAKEERQIEHICFSAHCDGLEISQILDENFFDGVLLGFNVLNYKHRLSGIQKAGEKKIGVAIMNPLGGGMIPSNPEYFNFLEFNGNSIIENALQFIAAHNAVSTILIGIKNKRDLTEAITAISKESSYSEKQWYQKISSAPEPKEPLCTLCNYCSGCPAGLKVDKLMGIYNEYILSSYNESHFFEYNKMFLNLSSVDVIPCVKCGKCESVCTQHLPIIKRFDIWNSVLKKENDKLKAILEYYFPNTGYPKTGIYGLSLDAENLMNASLAFYGHLPADIAFFDSNSAKWGNKILGTEHIIHPPLMIRKLGIKRILITARKYAKEISEYLKDYIEEGTAIEAL